MHPIATLFLFVAFLTNAALATPSTDSRSQAEEAIIVSCPVEGWPPFLITDEQSAGRNGIMLDVMREITSRTGHTLTLVHYPEKRGMLLFHQGKVHAYPKARKWVPAPELYLWTDPVVETRDVVVSRASAPIDFKTPSDLIGKNIALVHSFRYPQLEPYIKDGSIRRHDAKDTETILRLVATGRVDAAVTSRSVALWIAKTSKHIAPGTLVFSETPLDSAPYRFAFVNEPKWKRFINAFNRELAAMKRDGRMQAILDRYR